MDEEQEEEYQFLLRSLSWTDGFGLFFVECISEQAERIIERLKSDLQQKSIEILSFSEPIDNLYNYIDNLPSRDNIDILCIEGLEYSLNDYIKPGFGGQGDYYREDSVPRILAHLNLQRERFRESFDFCLLFLLPKFAVKYFIRRAPDFYDWRSGTFEFSTDKDVLDRIIRIIDTQFQGESFENSTVEQCYKNLLKIDSVLEEELDKPTKVADLFLKKGMILFKMCRFEESINCFDKFIEVYPEQEEINFVKEVNFIKGAALLNLGQLKDALVFMEQYAKTNPSDSEFWVLIANLYIKLNQYQEALNSFDKAIELNSNNYQLWNDRARVLTYLGRFDEALSNFDKAIALNPDSYQLFLNRARVLFFLERYKEALENFNKVIELNANDYIIWTYHAVTLFNLEFYQDSLASYSKALELNPSDYRVWGDRGNALAKLERNRDALESFDQAIGLNSDDYRLWSERGHILAKLGRNQEALDSFKKAIALKSNDCQLWLNSSRLLHRLERYSDELVNLEQAIKLEPDNYQLWYYKGITLFLLESYQESINSYHQALVYNPTDHDTLSAIIHPLYKLDFYNQAIEYARKTLHLNSEDSGTWNALGYLLLRQYSKEKPQFNIPLKIHTHTIHSEVNVSRTSEESQYYEESLNCFNKALQLKQPDDEFTFLYWANRCYPLYYLGRYQEALSSSK
ncbi:MAG: tetratricopeptide repeat protein [Microcystaceae cyanobacterium]